MRITQTSSEAEYPIISCLKIDFFYITNLRIQKNGNNMCFSTEASFTAAILLGATGGLTLKKTTSRAQFFIAAIPILFAIQQFSEGIIWLFLSGEVGSHELFINAERSFLTFAFLVWPIWIPLSFALIEPVTWRRYLLFINLYCGVALSGLNLTYALREEVTVKIVNHSIQYMGNIPDQIIIYPLIVMLPMFLSSLKNVWIYGVLLVGAYVVADYFYTVTFASVWCFFSAIVSLFIYKILKDNQ